MSARYRPKAPVRSSDDPASLSGLHLEIDIAEVDSAYVEQRGGTALLSYLREGTARAEHRREAIQRAVNLYDKAAATTSGPTAEVGGYGLLVLQRALFAVEDLGVLLHAFAGDDPWTRLRSARIPDLQRAFHRAVNDLDAVLTESFVLATEGLLSREDLTDDQHAALLRLRELAVDRWGRMLARIAGWWVNYFNIAKATMHGFPFVAGKMVTDSPGAGLLGVGLGHHRPPFAVAVTSRDRPTRNVTARLSPDGTPIHQREIATTRTAVALDERNVADFARTGRLAARLTAELCEHQRNSIMSRHRGSIPLRAVRYLDSDHRRAIRSLQPND